MPKISIIVPVYNVEKYLHNSIESILNQTFADFELILINDGSTDKSGEICDSFAKKDGRIKVIHTNNRGVSSARNIGVATANGTFIGFVDSDDIIEPDMYSILLDVALKTNSDIVQCRHNNNNEIENLPRKINVKFKTAEQYVKDIFEYKGPECTNQLALWSKIYRSELLDNIIFPVGQVYEDEHEIYKICLKANKIATIDDELYHYVYRDNSIINAFSAKKCLDKQLALLERYHYLPKYIAELEEKCALSFYYYSVNSLINLYYKDITAYKQVKKKLCLEYKNIKKYINMYNKIYYVWLYVPFLEWILMKNNYEPIQNLIRLFKNK